MSSNTLDVVAYVLLFVYFGGMSILIWDAGRPIDLDGPNVKRVKLGRWHYVYYNTKTRCRRCMWCAEWVPEWGTHKPHWVEFRRRWHWNFHHRNMRFPISDELPVDNCRCPRDLRKLRKTARDVIACPSRFCNYAIDGLTFYNRRKHGTGPTHSR